MQSILITKGWNLPNLYSNRKKTSNLYKGLGGLDFNLSNRKKTSNRYKRLGGLDSNLSNRKKISNLYKGLELRRAAIYLIFTRGVQ